MLTRSGSFVCRVSPAVSVARKLLQSLYLIALEEFRKQSSFPETPAHVKGFSFTTSRREAGRSDTQKFAKRKDHCWLSVNNCADNTS